ncbi:glutathione S-transferase [Pseudidiomarina aestuarii]|uniref:Glutathione S-transferase n=1 Tax=Pseudidiomarina aestuarii TaxID=624146 RepID=A0A7Z6ZVB2_9GAMM|nr:glutathione S-transferase [Pseudidiomarina aestuarii]RUO42073.1 glutathione S-transferase [Pseudidiomarina aestuarii]
MKLYGSYTSPFVRHCRIVLALNQQEFEFIPTDRAGAATGSPTQRVPFFRHDDVKLHDSAAILRYLRERAEQPFCTDSSDFDLFCLVNTALDTTVNLFLLEMDGLTGEQSSYLKRQESRVETVLAELEKYALPDAGPYTDGQLRLACYLSWAVFRKRIDIQQYPRLQQFLAAIDGHAWFANTHPALS